MRSMSDFMRSKGFIPGGEATINGEVWTAAEVAAAINPDTDWGTCSSPTNDNHVT